MHVSLTAAGRSLLDETVPCSHQTTAPTYGALEEGERVTLVALPHKMIRTAYRRRGCSPSCRAIGLPEIDREEDRVMICGSPGLLRDLKHQLGSRGYAEGNTSTPGHFVIERAFAEQ